MQHIRIGRRAVALAATAALTTGGALAVAAPGVAATGRAAAAPVAQSFTVTEHAITDTEVPVAPGGKDEVGDPLVFHNPVFNAADTTQVGHDEGFCTRIDVKLGTWECLWTTFLKGGQITVQGPYYDTKNSTLTVTGGTGAYEGATGAMGLVAKDGGKEYRFEFHLTG